MTTKRAKGGDAEAPLGVSGACAVIGYDSIEDGHRDLIFSFLGLPEARRAEAVSRGWQAYTAAALIWRARVLDVYPSLRRAQAAPAAGPAAASPAVDWKARCRGLRREQPESPAADVLASINAQYEFHVQVDFFRLAHAAEDDDLEPRARLARVSRASADATLVHGADAAFDMGDHATKFVVTLGSPLGVDVGGTELAQLGAEYTLLAVRRADGAVSKVLSCDCEFVRSAENGVGDLGNMGVQHEGGQLWGFDHQHGQLAGPAHLEHLGGLNAFGDLGDTCQWAARKCTTGSHVYAFTKLTFGVWFADAQHAKCVSTAGFAMLLKLLWWT